MTEISVETTGSEDEDQTYNVEGLDTNNELQHLLTSQNCSYKKKKKLLEELSFFDLLFISCKHVLWVFVKSMPSILFVSLVGYAYSRLRWTNPVHRQNHLSHEISTAFYNMTTILIFDNVSRSAILSVLPVLLFTVMKKDWKFFRKNVLVISLPLFVASVLVLGSMYNYKKIWYYYIDIAVFEFVFLASIILCSYEFTSNEHDMSFMKLLRYFLFPAIIAAVGIGFIDIYLSKKYQLYNENVWQKYLIRLIVYPIFVDCIVSFGEYNMRQLNICDIDSRAHVIYFYQVAFGIIGRYMTLTSGSLKYIALFAFLIGLKDVLMHRMSRFQCWVAFQARRFVAWCKCMEQNEGNFHEWFYNEDFKIFRAHVLNNEYINELTTAFVVPVVVVTFERHKLLFNFQYESFFNKNGQFDNAFFFEQELVQLAFILLSFICITMIEAKFNGVDLRVVFKKIDFMQHCSQILIFFWGLFLLLSSVRVLPNYFQCPKNDICSCTFQVNYTNYGCSS